MTTDPAHPPPSDSDGTPQPASEPMSKSVADWYVNRTHGQLQAYPDADGQWRLYDARTPKLFITPKVPITP